jgi:2-polyprenyl-3-methyl-5-hydroxy-6-metoxy-1,4-benzoquinol methylase
MKNSLSTDTENYFERRGVRAHDCAKPRLPAYLARQLALKEQARILDFGCGLGQLLVALKGAGFQAIEGFDIDPQAVARCRSLGFICHDGPAQSAFYDDHHGQYDFVIMSHVLEHFPKQLIIQQLARIKQLLTQDGALIIMVPNAQSSTGCYWAYEDFTHHVLFTSGSLRYVLTAAGFTQIEFLDPYCVEGLRTPKRWIRLALLALYRLNYHFWNRVTASAVHAASPVLLSYEIKALARA